MLSPLPHNDPPLSTLAVASLALGLVGVTAGVGLVFVGVAFPFVSLALGCLPAAAVLGAVAIRRINRTPSELRGKAIAVAGFAVGLVGIIAIAALVAWFALGFAGR